MARKRSSDGQMPLPGVHAPVRGEQGVTKDSRRIPHRKILESLQGAECRSVSLASLYVESVLPVKTRTIQLLGRKGPARIMETLLGYEVQAAYKRIQCPDLVTARYLKLFSELGCRSIRLPYDPTVTAALIPQMEKAVAALDAGVRQMFPRNRAVRLYVLRKICCIIRSRLRVQPPIPHPQTAATSTELDPGPDAPEGPGGT
jgi:hypothetical protein